MSCKLERKKPVGKHQKPQKEARKLTGGRNEGREDAKNAATLGWGHAFTECPMAPVAFSLLLLSTTGLFKKNGTWLSIRTLSCRESSLHGTSYRFQGESDRI